jgi:hypothetical protein
MKTGKLYRVESPTIATPLFSTSRISYMTKNYLLSKPRKPVDLIHEFEYFMFLEKTEENEYKILFKDKVGYVTSRIACQEVTKEFLELFREHAGIV